MQVCVLQLVGGPMTKFRCQTSPFTSTEALEAILAGSELQEFPQICLPFSVGGHNGVTDSHAAVSGLHLVSGDLNSGLRHMKEVLLPTELSPRSSFSFSA